MVIAFFFAAKIWPGFELEIPTIRRSFACGIQTWAARKTGRIKRDSARHTFEVVGIHQSWPVPYTDLEWLSMLVPARSYLQYLRASPLKA